MKNKNNFNIVKAGITIGIALVLLMPISIVYADDITPPEITDSFIDPPLYVGSLTDVILSAVCIVHDESGIPANGVKLVVEGPNNLHLNLTMIYDSGNDIYFIEYSPVPSYGLYTCHIWAIDTWGNQNTTDNYFVLILADYLQNVYIDDSAVPPYEGSMTHPFPTIPLGLAAVATGGNVFVQDGTYQGFYVTRNVTLWGENQETTIITGTIQLGDNMLIGNLLLKNFTIQGSIDFTFIEDSIVENCTIQGDTLGAGIELSGSGNTIRGCTIRNHFLAFYAIGGAQNNYIYYNNFIDNTNIIDFESQSFPNTWDDGTIGNYWDDYRERYPDATINPLTGTWNNQYVIFYPSNIDHHPWVYPDGFIDTTSPVVTVLLPNGGETVSGSTLLQWSATDDLSVSLNGTIRIEYSADVGSNWTDIASGLDNTGSYSWDTTTVENGDQYLIRITAADEFANIGSDVSDVVFTVYNNHPPGAPNRPTGPTNGFAGTNYTFCIEEVTDPEGDPVFYKFSWGDGNESDWSTELCANHTWFSAGLFAIRAKAKDSHNASSPWGPILAIQITLPASLVVDAGGPYSGVVGQTIQFTGSATGGATPYNWSWDFGDGNTSSVKNPGHSYLTPGNYTVKLTVTDSLNTIANDTTYAIISSMVPPLDIGEITGGLLKVTAEIKNTGDTDISNVTWTIKVYGGILKGINVSVTGPIETLTAGETKIETATPIFGLGKVNIIVTASAESYPLGVAKYATAFVFGPFVLGVKLDS